MRTRYQGIGNVVRFNWHFYLIGGVACFLAIAIAPLLPEPLSRLSLMLAILALILIVISLAVSHLVYDRSDVYSLPLLGDHPWPPTPLVVNIHAGFDEISDLLRRRFPEGNLMTWDFYDPSRHTEISIRRARDAHPPDSDPVSIDTARLPADSGTVDLVCLVFAAHEIRSYDEQVRFFAEITRILNSDGRVCVVEHLRDLPNGLAYSVGCLHFHPRSRWLAVFRAAGLVVERERKDSWFTTGFLLRKTSTGDATVRSAPAPISR